MASNGAKVYVASPTAEGDGDGPRGGPSITMSMEEARKQAYAEVRAKKRSQWTQQYKILLDSMTPGEKEIFIATIVIQKWCRGVTAREKLRNTVRTYRRIAKGSALFQFVENPHYSKGAQRLANFMTITVVASIVAFCLDTEDHPDDPDALTGGRCNFVCWFLIDMFFVIIFTVEFFGRLWIYRREDLAHMRTWRAPAPETGLASFVRDPLNWIDLAAIVPSYVELLIWATRYDFDPNAPRGGEVVLRLMKLFKCFRVFKLMKHFSGTDVLIDSIAQSLHALMVPFFFLGVFVLLFASFLFFLEQGVFDEDSGVYLVSPAFRGANDTACKNAGCETDYANIPTTAYFLMITMTTVGYGDQYPNTLLGKILTIICAIFGILFLAMPLAIVGNSFYNNWNMHLRKRADELRERAQAEEAKAMEEARRRKAAQKRGRRRSLQATSLASGDFEVVNAALAEEEAAEKRAKRKHMALVQHFKGPGPVRKKLNGAGRDIVTSYLQISGTLGRLEAEVAALLDRLGASAQGNRVRSDSDARRARAALMTAATGIGTVLGSSSSSSSSRKEGGAGGDPDLPTEAVEILLTASIMHNAVFGGLIGKSTKSTARNLWRSARTRIRATVKMQRWASLHNRHDSAMDNAEIAAKGERGFLDRLYMMLEFPESSKAAHLFQRASIVVILLSIIAFMVESVPGMHRAADGSGGGLTEPAWFGLEATFTFLFSAEFIARWASSPQRGLFWKDVPVLILPRTFLD